MRPWATRETKHCKRCGEPIIWLTSQSEYCTIRCRQKANEERRPICTRCGVRVPAQKGNRLYCDDCREEVAREQAIIRNQHRKAKRELERRKKEPRMCKQCGKSLLGTKRVHVCATCPPRPKPVNNGTLPPDKADHQKEALRRFRERQDREAAFDTATGTSYRASTLAAAGSKPSQAALTRENALTGAAGAVSYGGRQATSHGGGE